jgi:(4S)-4-hydroxy-5-phosphonooxypentane-2,3-dione isomerase
MIVTCVYVEVRPEYIQAFIEETTRNHNESVKEKDNLRFDLIQEVENPNRFMLYEAYQTEEASIAHKKTAHYAKWRSQVEMMMARPRHGVKNNIICPKEIK